MALAWRPRGLAVPAGHALPGAAVSVPCVLTLRCVLRFPVGLWHLQPQRQRKWEGKCTQK